MLEMPLTGRHPDDGFSNVPYTKGALLLTRLEQAARRPAFDAFLRGWFDRHAFESATTRDFLADLRRELPAAFVEVDVHAWTTEPGLPADAPRPAPVALLAADAQAEAFVAGTAPATLDTAGWTTQQWLRFLRALPSGMTPEQMTALDEAFGFTRSGNSEILCQWLELSIAHGYAAADASLEAFLRDVGRRKFLKPLYTALVKADAERARTLYEANRARYHSVSTGTLDGIVRASG
jgi:leukotriene-A4 hydrolase